ncbi:50S ribosomal protein L23 [Candidatus Liberibacter sp.]|uniref:50S ribosomal protein L23 n=1 Tax=Candidatus Liberibacter sp. TaxID=34022 RepID=UPI0015F42E65|nr:50S ribosomal protein L23 [Candidatus Liberibacter sp.]MBA5724539.1 50S ribosomal protein L23 [Candidatus Liberibacter sp.]
MIDVRFYDTVVAPVITEKATLLSENNQVIFTVRKDATKSEIKFAIEALFSVKVESVNTLIRKGKTKRISRVSVSRSNAKSARDLYVSRKDVKKAFVTLAKGHSIDISVGL